MESRDIEDTKEYDSDRDTEDELNEHVTVAMTRSGTRKDTGSCANGSVIIPYCSNN